MRIEKFLADMGYGSRKEVKQLLQSGFVWINGVPCRKAGSQVDPTQDEVQVGDTRVRYQKYAYYLLNKPEGIISATEDGYHQTVVDWMGEEYAHWELFPVGRLDIDTTGLLLMTNNGQLAHQLLSPKKKVSKLYQATIQGIVTQADVQQFADGLDLGDFVTLPAQLMILSVDEQRQQSQIQVEIWEGKFHQVKRMFEAVGKTVMQLHRLSMGPLQLDANLATGEWRELTTAEQKALEPYGFSYE